MRTLLLSVVLASGKVTDLSGRLDALKGDHIKMACPLGSLGHADALLAESDRSLTTTITQRATASGGCSAL